MNSEYFHNFYSHLELICFSIIDITDIYDFDVLFIV